MAGSPPPIHALVDDLFFRAKIDATAKAAGVPVEFAASAGGLAASLEGGDTPVIVLVDLAYPEDPAAVIRAIRARRPSATIVAFGAHRETERLTTARAAGADRVLARSAFAQRLPEILTGRQL